MSLVLFPDVEALLVTYLRDALAARPEQYARAVHVDNVEPSPRPARSIVVRRDGGALLDDFRDNARVSFQVWAMTDADATDLANLVRSLYMRAADGRPVLRVREQSGPTAVPDDSGQPLRYLVAEFVTRGVPA